MKRYPLAMQIRKYLIPYILVVTGAIGLFAYVTVTYSLKHTYVSQSGTIRNLFIQSVSNDLLMGSFSEVYRNCTKFSENSGVEGIEITFDGRSICKITPENKKFQTFEEGVYYDEGKTKQAALVKIYLSTADLDSALYLVNIIAMIFAVVISGLTYFLTRIISRKVTDPISEMSDIVRKEDLAGLSSAFDGNSKSEPEEIYLLKQSIKELADRLNNSLMELQKGATYKAIAQTTQMMAHDVRRPFMMLKEMLHCLDNSDVAKKSDIDVVKYNENISSLVDKVENLLQDVMNIDSKKEVIKSKILITSVLEKNIKDTESQFNRKIAFIGRSGDSFVNGNEEQISRVVFNLLQNAVEATSKDDDIVIQMSNEDSFIFVNVRNTGSEISNSKLSSVFDPFFTEGKDGGTGLGLAICKKIIDDHGGDLSCYSENGETIFTFKLPRYKQQKLADKVATLIVVDDCPFIRDMWKSQINDKIGLHIFSSPEEVLSSSKIFDALKDKKTCVVSDYYFDNGREMNGIQLGRSLRERGFLGPLYLSTNAKLDSNVVSAIDAELIRKQPSEVMSRLGL